VTLPRSFVRPLVRPMVRSGAVGPYGGATYQDGIHLNFASGNTTSGYYVKAVGAAPTVSPLTSLFTFTGGNQSMYMGPAGLLVASATNTPRIEYDANGNCLGLLMEAARTNLWLQSQTFDNASWTKVRASVSADTVAAPDGTTTADTLIEDGTAATTHLLRQDYASATSGTTYTISTFAKAKERSQILIVFGADTAAFASEGVLFTLSGSGSASVSGGSPVAYGIQEFPNGWYRCWVSATCASTTNAVLRIYMAAGSSSTYSGDGASGVYLWGAQLEAGRFPSSYIPTTTISVARTADSCIRTLGSEFSATAGTVVVAGKASGGQAVGIGQCVWSLWTDVNNRYTYVRPSASDVARLTINNGGVNQATLDATFTSSASFKAASAWVANDFATTINGAAVLTDGAGTLPAVAVLGLGELGDTSSTMNGHILRFDYHPVRKPKGFLVQQSTPGP